MVMGMVMVIGTEMVMVMVIASHTFKASRIALKHSGSLPNFNRDGFPPFNKMTERISAASL